MSFSDWGNPPINSTNTTELDGSSTTTMAAVLDSTQLGTKNLVAGQKLIAKVSWIVASDTLARFSCEVASGSSLADMVQIFRPRVGTFQSAQFETRHELFKDYQIRVHLTSTNGGSNNAFLSAMIES